MPFVRHLLVVLAGLLILTGATAPSLTKDAPRPRVEIRTELGTMVVELYNETPQHRDNFLKLVREGKFDSLLWHRVIPAFMIQGGDPESRRAVTGVTLGEGSLGYTVPAEFNPAFVHTKGAMSAARTSDEVNPEKASSASQFYVVQGKGWQPNELQMLLDRKNRGVTPPKYSYTPEQIAEYAKHGGAPHLDGEYTVFGRVVEGLDVIDKIAAVPCDQRDRPLNDIRMWMRELKP
ncbi:MAG: peptidylprolyl isomerase [Flavobacteriales bacterium]|nr:MAG: peptidylprolyl isomerase [Flavobacteriales bacterium]